MPRSHHLAIAGLATTAAVALAAPAAADPVVRVDQECYSPGDVITVTGEGWTPSGTLQLSFTGATISLRDLVADPSGLLRAQIGVREQDAEAFIPADELQTSVDMVVIDERAAQEGRPAGMGVRLRLSHFALTSTVGFEELRPGRWSLYVSTSPTNHRHRPYVTETVTVR